MSAQPQQSISSHKSHRILACVRCQERKVKCNRVFPCSNCNTTVARAQCVPATYATRVQRKRRFPERELLERLRTYENLLLRNNIDFLPLHGNDENRRPPETANLGPSPPSETVKPDDISQPKILWHAWNKPSNTVVSGAESESSLDDVNEDVVSKSWDKILGNNDHLLFGSSGTNIDLSSLHPEPPYIFQLWQIYLDNVNPLLKVTHTPTLQTRIIEAASNLENIQSTLEALMFSIYCIALISLTADDCHARFGSSKDELLIGFRFGCQQALQKSNFLRSTDRDCLTALHLYLISVRSSTGPQSLSAMIGVAMRIAQRMGIHSEAVLLKCSVFEAELRRRLWWSLILFDARINELTDLNNVTLLPIWDCSIPLNLNDSDLHPDMKERQGIQDNPTESIFAVVRSELANFVRHTHFHLAFTCPALNHIFGKTAPPSETSELAELSNMVESRYIRLCNSDNPLQFATMYWTKAYFARNRLLEHHSRHSTTTSGYLTDEHRDIAMSHAISMLECDTDFMKSPHSKRFYWLSQLHFPFPAYFQIIQDLKTRPGCVKAEQAWMAMSENYESRFADLPLFDNNPFFDLFNKLIMQAWRARVKFLNENEETYPLPSIVSMTRIRVSEQAGDPRGQQNHENKAGADQLPNMAPVDFNHVNLFDGIDLQAMNVDSGLGVYPDMLGNLQQYLDGDSMEYSLMK